jgi:hypothetical protein
MVPWEGTALPLGDTRMVTFHYFGRCSAKQSIFNVLTNGLLNESDYTKRWDFGNKPIIAARILLPCAKMDQRSQKNVKNDK